MTKSEATLSVRKSGKRGCGTLLALCLLLAGVGYALFQGGSLPRGVHPVPGTQDGMALSGPIWASDHEVFTYSIDAKLVDTRTGTFVPVPGFGGNGFYTGLVQVSPDGNAVLWANARKKDPQWCVSSLRGVEQWHVPRFEAEGRLASAAWLPDSRHWVELRGQHGTITALIHSLEDTRIVQFHLLITAPYLKIVGFTPEGDALAIENDQQRNRGIPNERLIQFPLKENSRIVKTMTLAPVLPPSEHVQGYEFAVSPNGREIAWLFSAYAPPVGLEALTVLLTGQRSMANSQTASVWITDVDGSHPRRILAGIGSGYFPVNLNWEKDGRHLSFYCRRALYAFPVN